MKFKKMEFNRFTLLDQQKVFTKVDIKQKDS